MKDSIRDWTVNFITHSREEAILMADFVARAFEPRFFHDRNNVAVITVTGGFNNGKSMICEAMTRSLLDQESVQEMIREGQRFHHFLERAPSTAMSEYCYKSGTIAGIPATVSFDRLAPLERKANINTEFRNNFKFYPFGEYELKPGFSVSPKGRLQGPDGKRAHLKEAFTVSCQNSTGGAIFSSGRQESLQDARPWLDFDILQPHYQEGPDSGLVEKPGEIHDPNHPKWTKDFIVTVHANELKASPRFQSFWRKLQEYAETGVLKEPELSGPIGKLWNKLMPK